MIKKASPRPRALSACVLALLSSFIPGLFSEPPPKLVVVATPTPTPARQLVRDPTVRGVIVAYMVWHGWKTLPAY